MRQKVTAVCAAAMLLLTGCGGNGTKKRETDLSQRYPDYFKYCFGADAQFSFLENRSGSDIYALTYRDHTGAERKDEIEVAPYDPALADDESKTEYYNSCMISCVADQMEEIARSEFEREVLEPVLEGHWDAEEHWVSDTEQVLFSASFQDKAYGKRLADDRLKAGSGWQVCTADWKTVVSDELEYVIFSLTVSENADAAEYTERFEQIAEQYLNCTDQPKSVSMSLRQEEPEGRGHETRPLAVKEVILGEAVTGEQYGEDSTPQLYLGKKLQEKYSS